jgi:hypothetical protein
LHIADAALVAMRIFWKKIYQDVGAGNKRSEMIWLRSSLGLCGLNGQTTSCHMAADVSVISGIFGKIYDGQLAVRAKM